MRDRIAIAARENSRTMNAEIVARLNDSFQRASGAAVAFVVMAGREAVAVSHTKERLEIQWELAKVKIEALKLRFELLKRETDNVASLNAQELAEKEGAISTVLREMESAQEEIRAIFRKREELIAHASRTKNLIDTVAAQKNDLDFERAFEALASTSMVIPETWRTPPLPANAPAPPTVVTTPQDKVPTEKTKAKRQSPK